MPEATANTNLLVFDRHAVRRHRDRAAPRFDAHRFLFDETADRLLDRLDDIKRRFPTALDLGCHTGLLAKAMAGRGGIETLVQCDPAPEMVQRASGLRLVAEEDLLPFGTARFDLVLSLLSLHWVNDLPGALVQINRSLKPDGLFLGCLLGGDTLSELRAAWMAAEIDVEGGASPRVSPFVDVRDAGALLQRAGFALPVVDSDVITVSYGDPMSLMQDLRWMGESNAVRTRRTGFTRRRTLLRAAEIYVERFGRDGRLPATFQVITLTGWHPDKTAQQQPLRRGSGQTSLADVLSHTPKEKD